MALAFNKFQPFVEALAEKVHNLGSDTLKVVLSNAAPNATDGTLSQITQIANGGGYTTGGTAVTVSASSQSAGTYKLVINPDPTFLATSGGMATFRYIILYNDTASNDELIGWWDHGSGLTLTEGDSYTPDFNATNGVLQIA